MIFRFERDESRLTRERSLLMITPLCNVIGNSIIESRSSRGSHPPRSPESDRSERRRGWSDRELAGLASSAVSVRLRARAVTSI